MKYLFIVNSIDVFVLWETEVGGIPYIVSIFPAVEKVQFSGWSHEEFFTKIYYQFLSQMMYDSKNQVSRAETMENKD